MRSLCVLAIALVAAPALGELPRSEKPSAPVTLTLTKEHDAAGWRVVLDATPARDVPAIELAVAGATARFGATRAGQHRRLTARVDVPAGGGIDVVGRARVGTPSRNRSRVTTLRVGAPAPAEKAAAYRIVIVGGRGVAEVGP